MSSNNSIRKAFIADDGGVRCVWRLIAAYALWFALFVGASLATGGALTALFDLWGVNVRNLARAPEWVQYIAVYQTRIAGFICSALTALIGGLAYRKYSSLPRPGLRGAIGFGAGILTALTLSGIFLLCDSIRLETPTAVFSTDLPLMLLCCAAAAFAEGFAAMGYARAMTAARCGRIPSYIAAALMFLIMNHSAPSGVTGVISLIFMAVAGCCVAERFGVGAFIGLRAGWLWTTTALIGQSGSIRPMFSAYPVSEHALTGGYHGLSEGLAPAIICAAVIFFLLVYPRIRKKY